MTADSAAFRECRNTVIVLITAGKDDGDAGYQASHNPETIATGLRTVTASGVTKRFPVHVVAVRPEAADVTQLQNIATNSGGSYRNASSANQIAQAINYAVQHGFSRSTDFEAARTSEYLPVSPVIGTVNLENGRSSTGAALPNTDIVANPGGQPLAQRSNILLTSRLRAPDFRWRVARLPRLPSRARLDQAYGLEVHEGRHAALAGSRRTPSPGREGADAERPDHAQHLYLHPERCRRRHGRALHRRRTRQCCVRT